MENKLYTFIELCKMKEGTVFTNPSMTGNTYVIVNEELLVLKAKGWEKQVNPVSQVGMKRFIVIETTKWNSELLKYKKQQKG